MEAVRTRWSDERLDDLKGSVDSLTLSVENLRHAMIIAVIAVCTMMFAGFGALITLVATHF
jgi:hypothetical protein